MLITREGGTHRLDPHLLSPDVHPLMADSSTTHSENRRSLGIVWLTVFIDLVGFSIIFPIFPAMLEWYLPRAETGSLLHSLITLLESFTPAEDRDFYVAVLFGGFLGALYSMLQFFAAPLWGRLSDRHGRRQILLLTTSGTALAYLIWIFSGAFWVLLFSRFLAGAMAGNIAVATATVADLTNRQERSKGMALIGIAFGLGFILGPAIGGLGTLFPLNTVASPETTFGFTPFSVPAFAAFLLALINLIWIWKAFPETLPMAKTEDRPAKRPLFRFGSEIPDVRRGLKVYFLFIFAFAGMEFTLTFLALERLDYQPHQMPLLFLFVGIVMALTQGLLVRRYGHRFGERNFTTLGLLCAFLGLMLLSSTFYTVWFYAGIAFLGFGVGCVSPSLASLVSLYSPTTQQGASQGAFRSTGALARAIGPLFGAGLFGLLGSQTAYLAGAILMIMAALFSLLLPRPTSSEP